MEEGEVNPDYWVKVYRANVMKRRPLDSVDRVASLDGKPSTPPTPEDWDAVRERLGCPLPADYMRFIDEFGPGQLGAIRVCAPRAADAAYDLFALIDRVHMQAAEFRSKTEPPFNAPFHPQPGGLVPWGEMDGGFTFFWCPAGDDVDEWPVMVSDPGWLAWYKPYLSFSTLVADYLESPTGSVRGMEFGSPAENGVGVRFVSAS